MKDKIDGWAREKRVHFDEIVAKYDKVRHEYPPGIFGDVIKFGGFAGSKKAIEIGAGTGKATTPFLQAGFDVTAIEISPNMAEFLLEKFSEYQIFEVKVTSFEDASLPENSYDLIYAASAFHWVDAAIGCPKAYRLLKDGGVIALLRYNLMSSNSGEHLENEIDEAYDKHYHSYYGNKKMPQNTRADLSKPSRILAGFGFEDLRDYGFVDVSMNLYDKTRVYAADEYIEWLDTMSDHRSLPEENRLALYAEVKQAIQNHGGNYELNFVFQSYMGRKA